jgi:hypothetical protein
MIASRGNRSNPAKVIAKPIHTFPFTPGVSQTKIPSTGGIAKAAVTLPREAAALPGSRCLAIQE